MNLKLKKVYTVSNKARKPRLFLQHIVCEAAGLNPGENLYISINEYDEKIVIQNYPSEAAHTIKVASRVSKISGERRPLIDTAGDKYATIIDVKQKIEISVFKKGNKSQIVIEPLKYNLFENETLPAVKDERIRLLSIAAGAGIGTAAFVDTNYYSAIQEVELEEDSAEVLLHNFPNSYVFNGNMADCHQVYKSDIAMVTLPCNEHSNLGDLSGNVVNDLILATAKIIKTSQAEALFFENVPNFYKSESWNLLKDLLSEDYPFWVQKDLDAWDFGSIANRKRTYVCSFKSEDQFNEFRFPAPQKMKRKKLKDFLEPAGVTHEWKSVDDWMTSFNSRTAWAERSLDLTFVSKEAERIACLPKRYTSHSASSSYVLSEDKKSWRFLTIEEIKKILAVPKWFQLTKHLQKIRTYELLGQSIDCRVVKAIANRLAFSFMKIKDKIKPVSKKIQGYGVKSDGQLQLLI